MILPVIWYYIAGCQSFKSKKTLPSAWVPNKCTGPSTFGGNFDDSEVTLNQQRIFPCAPKLFHVMFHQIMSPSCAPYKRVSLKSALGSSGNEKSQSVTSNLNIPTSPCLGHLWFLKVPIPPLPQLIEPTHAQITQPHEILNIISGTIGAISEWFDLSNCQSLTKSRTFPSSQSFSNLMPYQQLILD